MSYNPQLERTILIGIDYKEAAKELAKLDKRKLKGYMENLIEADAKKHNIIIKKVLT